MYSHTIIGPMRIWLKDILIYSNFPPVLNINYTKNAIYVKYDYKSNSLRIREYIIHQCPDYTIYSKLYSIIYEDYICQC